MAPVEYGYGKQVEKTQVDADDRHHPDEEVRAFSALLTGNFIDSDRPADLGQTDLALNHPKKRNGDEARDLNRLIKGLHRRMMNGLRMVDALFE